MSWDDAEKDAASKFLKFDDAPFELAFRSDPKIDKKHFVGGQPNECAGDDCEHCAKGVDLSVSYVFDVYDYKAEDNRVLSLSRKAFRALLEVRQRINDDAKFARTRFFVDRKGAGKGIRYIFEIQDQVEGEIPF